MCVRATLYFILTDAEASVFLRHEICVFLFDKNGVFMGRIQFCFID